MSDVYYCDHPVSFSDEKDCVATVYDGEFRYRVYYFPMTETYTIMVDGTVYAASSRDSGGASL